VDCVDDPPAVDLYHPVGSMMVSLRRARAAPIGRAFRL